MASLSNGAARHTVAKFIVKDNQELAATPFGMLDDEIGNIIGNKIEFFQP